MEAAEKREDGRWSRMKRKVASKGPSIGLYSIHITLYSSSVLT